jgi:hypothetical protein
LVEAFAIANANPGLALMVIINDIDTPMAKKFIQKIMRQLPGVLTPEILVRLNSSSVGATPQQDAKNAA